MVASMTAPDNHRAFELAVLPHLDAAYNYARWLTRDDSTAEDVVQEACLRALKFFGTFRGGNGRPWLLAIVRNAYYAWLEKIRPEALNVPFDEETFDDLAADTESAVDRSLEEADQRRLLNHALEQLPTEYREAIVLRELEDLSYKQIASIAGIPIGTVMSRLARGRRLLQQELAGTAPPIRPSRPSSPASLSTRSLPE
jgi:RNA polymerase sigma-70 factor (ECF subfamily)